MSKYYVLVDMTHGYMSNQPESLPYKLNDIYGFKVLDNCFTNVGSGDSSVFCRNLQIMPSGLIIPIYISREVYEYHHVLEQLINIFKDDVDRVEVELSMDELPVGNKQVIKIIKEK